MCLAQRIPCSFLYDMRAVCLMKGLVERTGVSEKEREKTVLRMPLISDLGNWTHFNAIKQAVKGTETYN